MTGIWWTSASIEIFLCSLTATTAHLLMSLCQTLFHRYLGHRGIGGSMLVRLTPKSTRFGDDFVGTLAHCMLARLSPLHFGCCHEPVYSPSYVGATACPLIPSNDRNALNG